MIKTAFILLGFVLPLASVLTWMERKQSALMQDRIGPNRASVGGVRAFGLMHFVADALKMLFKEDFVPAKANKFLFGLAPVLAIAPVLITFAIIPWGGGVCPGRLSETLTDETLATCLETGARFQVVHLEVGLLFYFAIASLAVYGTTLAGWASYNKFSLLGGLRASSQMMSYEVTMGMAILGAFLVYGSLEPATIVMAQGSNPLHWGIVTQPLGFILFFVAAIAETKRTPFDLPEGEPELIGYFVEYSGMRFGMFFLAEFMEVIFTAAVVATVFFGGWQLPGLHAGGFLGTAMPHWLVASLGFVVFAFKTFVLCWFQLMIRWTLPRFRPDQLMRLGWKQLLPLSIANILITAAVVLALMPTGGK
ncbi:MAG: NADH-quinone oxidoreductase subunit NuoH [Myxococcales bacterium]|nr:NADH-quinone oxidoreductase subunit NuoH [Myxococcales bacterium]